MTNNLPKTAKSARRKFTLTLLGVLATIAAASVVVYAAVSDTTPPPHFILTATPSTQTVTPGQPASYAIALDRQNQFVAPVALSINPASLPANTSVKYFPGPIPGSSSASTVVIETNVGGNTPAGTKQLTIKGTGGGISSSTTVTLTVLGQNAPNFTLQGRPSARHITENDSTSYSIAVSRAGNFTAPVTLSTSGLPRGAQANIVPVPGNPNLFDINVTTDNSVKPGSYPVIVSGVASGTTRYTSIRLNIEDKKPFKLEGEPTKELAPGDEAEIDLELSNPHNFEILVREITVSLDPHTDTPACSASVNFGVDQIPSYKYPIVLDAHETATLSALGFADDEMPATTMHNLDIDQNACKGAELTFQHSGWASKR